jgi:uncharacterized Ntn-hydrolase superfamily protein
VLRSAAVLDQSLAAFASATRKCGLPYSLLRALEAGSEAGGDRRCSPEQTALSAFLIVARPGDDADAPYLRLVSPDQPEGGANPVAVLDGLFREWVSLSGSEQLGCGS